MLTIFNVGMPALRQESQGTFRDLCSWVLGFTAALQEYGYLEFYAGRGNIHRAMRAAKYKSARFDIVDGEGKAKGHYMDISTSAGFSLRAQVIMCTWCCVR